MSSSRPYLIASILGPAIQAQGETLPQVYDYSYQLYQEDSDRIDVESHYIRGKVDITDSTAVRFQWLHDAISGASPTGALPGSSQPFLSEVEDVRTGILGAISQQFGDHRVELEISRSSEHDYDSRGYALSDKLELNQKNTTLSYGINYLDDTVKVYGLGNHLKNSYDLFTGVSQIIDKDTVVSANLTLGYSDGYLNDPYKVVQRNEVVSIPDGLGGTIDVQHTATVLQRLSANPDDSFDQCDRLSGATVPGEDDHVAAAWRRGRICSRVETQAFTVENSSVHRIPAHEELITGSRRCRCCRRGRVYGGGFLRTCRSTYFGWRFRRRRRHLSR